jgi:hydrogenase maturation factor
MDRGFIATEEEYACCHCDSFLPGSVRPYCLMYGQRCQPKLITVESDLSH